MAQLEPLMRRNFLEYASYSILDRAIPDIRDGCKPVQRRILQTLSEMNDGNFHKVQNVVGETMKLHPHGEVAIADALVVLANKDYFIEKQGNFGNPITGHPAAASRYIECRLTDLALETLFNAHLTEYAPSYDGRKQEAVFLPVKLPVPLLLGTDGIAVGMATKILPHNFTELLRAQIRLLQKKSVKLYPDFPNGGLIDVSEYDRGRGRVRLRAALEAVGDKKIRITAVPYSTTTESLIASIEAAAQKGRVKISSIDDYTTDTAEIELSLSRGVYADEVIPQLYAYTDCEVSLSSNIIVIRERHPEEITVPELLAVLTERLLEQIRAELRFELERLEERQQRLTLEQIFIEERVYKRIEKAKTETAITQTVRKGLEPHAKKLLREPTDEDIRHLLETRIRRISAWDIEKNRADLEAAAKDIRSVRSKLRTLVKTTIRYLDALLERYGERWPRQTAITTFEGVDKKAVAGQNIKLSYNRESSFFGSEVRGRDFPLQVSEFDRVLVISSDGSYRVVAPPDRMLLPRRLIYAEVFDREAGAAFTVVYRDSKKTAWGKKIDIQSFITDKEYRLAPDPKARVDLLIPEGEPLGRVQLAFVPAKRQRRQEAEFDLRELSQTGVVARGTRLAPKPVARVKLLRGD